MDYHKGNRIEIGPGGRTARVIIRSKLYGLHVAIIDAADAPLVSKGTWRVKRSPKRRHDRPFEVIGNVGHRRGIALGRYLLGAPPDGYVIDHRNGCTFDNRRCNLRVVTIQENSWNRDDASGCSFRRRENAWAAYIRYCGRLLWLGLHSTYEAAHAVHLAAKGVLHVIPERCPRTGRVLASGRAPGPVMRVVLRMAAMAESSSAPTTLVLPA